MNPYDDDQKVSKSERIGHAQKRMGKQTPENSKNKKARWKREIYRVINKKISTYYDLAIRRNIDSVQNMKNAIMTTYYHKILVLPRGKAGASGRKRRVFVLEFLSIPEYLSRDELLERFFGCHTQKATESFKSTINF